MSLSRALSNAQSGLSAASFRADITSNNVANANTPGYVRRTAVAAENTVGGQGNGVRISSVERTQDQGLTRLRREADATVSRSNIISASYKNLNQELGQPGDEYGLFMSYENLETSMRELSVTPESSALQNSLISASREIVNQFNALSSSANHNRSLADANISRDVRTVNEALHQIQKLNGDISGINQATGNAVSIEDERQALLDTIAKIIPIKDVPREGGQVDIVTESGVFLLSGSVKEINFAPAGVVGSHSDYATGTGNLSGLTVGDQDLTPGGGGNFSVASGSLAGHFAVRDSIIPTFSRQLDSLAGDLISRLSQDGLDPTKAAGAPGLFTDAGGAFDSANTTGAASRIRLNASVDPAQGGALYRLRDGVGATVEGPSGQSEILNTLLSALTTQAAGPNVVGLEGSKSTSELYAAISSFTGEASVRQDALAAGALTRANVLSDAEIETSGVDTDAELQSLLIIEQSYAANARVIQTISDMLDQLLAL